MFLSSPQVAREKAVDPKGPIRAQKMNMKRTCHSHWSLLLLVELFLILSLKPAFAQGEIHNRPELLLRDSYLGIVSSLAFSPDGRLIATAASQEGWVAVWDARTGFRLRVIQAYTENSTDKYGQHVSDVAFSPNGQILATSGGTIDDKESVRLWDTQTGRLLQELKGANGQIAFTPDGKIIATGVGRDRENSGILLKLWNAGTATPLVSIPGDESSVGTLTFDPTGTELVAAAGEHIIWFEVSTGKRRRTLETNEREVSRLVFDPKGDLLAVFIASDKDGEYKTISLQNISKNIDLFRTRIAASFILSGAPSPDTSVLGIANADGLTVSLWDIPTGKTLHTMRGHTTGPFLHLGEFSPDGRTLASGSGDDESRGDVILWDVGTGKARLTLGTPGYAVQPILFSKDGRFFAFSNGSIRIWDTRTGNLLRVLAPVAGGENTGVFNPDASLLASGSVDGSIKVWKVQSGNVLRSWQAHPDGVTTVEFSHDGRWLVTGGADKTIKIWDAKTWKQIATLPPQCDRIIDVAFSPDDSLLASACGSDETIVLWNTTSWKPLRSIGESTLNGVWVSGVEFSPDGRTIAIGKNILLSLWDVNSGKKLRSFNGDGEAISFSRDGRWVSKGGSQTTLQIMDTITGHELKALHGHDGPLVSAAFSRDGKLLVSGSSDGSARIWDPASGVLLATIVVPTPGSGWLVVTPDGLFDGTAEAMRLVTWRSNNDLTTFHLDAFFNDFYHPGLLAEIFEGGRPKATVDLATLLQLPGLRAMLSEGLARVDRRNGKPVLCLPAGPNARPQVYVDGNLLDVAPNEQFFENDSTCSYRVELPVGQQYELITAVGPDTIETFKPAYDGMRSKTAQSTLHILTMGIDNYDLTTSGFRALPKAVSGAREIEEFFTTQKRATNKAYRDIRIWDSLYDKAATRDGLRGRLAQMANEVKEDDVVFLFFSGHGVVPVGQEMFYFAPIDMRGPNPDDQRETGLNTAMLAEAIREMPARRIILIIDACQSGGAIDSLGKIAEVKAKAAQRRAPTESSRRSAKSDHRVGVYIVAAATPLQEAVQSKVGNSALVATLLEGLKKQRGRRGAQVWMRDLVKHIQQRLPEVSAQIGQRHTPMIVSSGVDFALAGPRRN